MRKLSLIVVGLAFLLTGSVYAAATKADRSRFGSSAQPNLTDSSNGNTVDISANGDLVTRPRAKSIYAKAGADITIANSLNEQGISGSTALFSLSFTGDNAGDTIVVYDGTSASGIPKFEIECGTAKQTVTIPLAGGAAFATEIYVKYYNTGGSATTDFVSLTYDSDSIS